MFLKSCHWLLIIHITHIYIYIRQNKKAWGWNRLDLIRIISFLYFEVNWQIRMCVLFLQVFEKKKSTKKILPVLIKLRIKVWEFDFNSEKKIYLQRAERGNLKRRNSKLFFCTHIDWRKFDIYRHVFLRKISLFCFLSEKKIYGWRWSLTPYMLYISICLKKFNWGEK